MMSGNPKQAGWMTLRRMPGCRCTVASGTPSFSWAMRAPKARPEAATTVRPGSILFAMISQTGRIVGRIRRRATTENARNGCQRSGSRAAA